MDVKKMLSELYSELEEIEHEIRSLERTGLRVTAVGAVSDTEREPDGGSYSASLVVH
jgi:hypothetical protein